MALNTAKLDAFRAGLDGAIDEGIFNAAGMVLDLARQLAPEDTGDLKASGHLDPPSADGSKAYRVVFGNATVDYARYVEEGTDNPNYPAQPYLVPAAKQIKVRDEIKASIRRLAGQ